MKRFGLILIFFLLNGFIIYSQDIHFSNTESSSVFLNPAQTGNSDGSMRFINSYRSQWSSITSPYKTTTVFFDKAMSLGNNKLFGGINLLYDASGIIGLKVSKFYLSGAYENTIGNGVIRFGLQAGYVVKQFSLDGVTFDSQWDNTMGSFNPALPNMETNMGESTGYFDINAGALFKTRINNSFPEIGFAISHLNKPNSSFFEKDYLDMAYTIQGKVNMYIGQQFSIQPAVIYQLFSKASSIVAGSHYFLYTPENENNINAIFFGTFVRTGFNRNTDSFIFLTGLDYYQFRVTLSYDINISELNEATQYKGAFEISLRWTGFSGKINSSIIPCFRQ